MAETPLINVPQSNGVAVVKSIAPSMRVPQGYVLGVNRKTAITFRTSQEEVKAVIEVPADVRVTQTRFFIITKSYFKDSRINAWQYTLDGHDFYVLRLGTDNETFVYDLITGQWSRFDSPGRPSWKVTTGLNWKTPGVIPKDFGSNVLVGSDTSGAIYVLDPEYNKEESYDGVPEDFVKVTTGQIIGKGRETLPIDNVYLRGIADHEGYTVTLSYSDNKGKTYIVADEPVVTGNKNKEIVWRSLGLMKAPGRLFQITDTGGISRIDNMDVNE